MTEIEKDSAASRADAQRLCDAWNSARESDSGLWVPRETAPGIWKPVRAHVPERRPLQPKQLARSRPAGARRLPTMPPIGPPPADEQRGTVGHAIGRALDYIGYGTFGLLALAPLLALAWVCVRLLGDSSDGALRLFAGIASALAVLSGWILYRVTEGNLRSIRNAWKPPALTWRQFELSQRLLYSAAIMIMLVGAAGIGVAIPTHL